MDPCPPPPLNLIAWPPEPTTTTTTATDEEPKSQNPGHSFLSLPFLGGAHQIIARDRFSARSPTIFLGRGSSVFCMQNCRVASDSHEKSKTFSGLGFPGKNVQKSSLIKGAGLGGKMCFFREKRFFWKRLKSSNWGPATNPAVPKKKYFPFFVRLLFLPHHSRNRS